MKRVVIAWNWGRGSEKIRRLLVTGRMFAILSIGSMMLVVVIGIGAIVQQKAATSPVSSMKGFAAAVSGGFFGNMLAMEMPGVKREDDTNVLSGKQAGAFLVRMLTDINPSDPHSLLAGEYPGMNGDRAVLLRGSAADAAVEPEDREPLPDPDEGGSDAGAAGAPSDLSSDGSGRPDPGPDAGIGSDGGEADGGNSGTADGAAVDPGTGGGEGKGAGQSGGTTDPAGGGGSAESGGAGDGVGQAPADGAQDEAGPTTGDRKVVFIYHSHSRESWFPELNGAKTAESATTNITLLGKRLQQKLEDDGIGALQSSTDYVTAVKNYNWALSYKYSKKTVTEAMASNKDLKFFFDIHRDSLRRKDTTATIGGKTYAQVFLIVGHANPGWKKNEAFAEQINDELEKRYPGITKGIWGKSTANGNGEYNQSVSPDSVLIEVGGVDNTLEECYRTIDALAEVISQLYWDAEKVDTVRPSDS